MNQIVESRIASHADDAEEAISTGRMNLSSSDLELGFVGSTAQIIGMRFNGIDIPQGAVITNAYLQYQVDETSSTASSIEFRGEATDNALQFSTGTGDISSRADTAASVSWSPPAWTTVGEAGLDQRTGDLSSIIQEIIDRPGWAFSNSLAITAAGSGTRVAESFNGKAAAAPLLHIEYAFTGAPTISIAATTNATEPATDGLFTVSLTNSSDTDTVIGYTVSGSATPGGQSGADYSALSGTLTIAAGALSATIPVRVLDDQQVEAGESVIVTLNGSINSGDPDINVNTSPATLTIADDDTPATGVQIVESMVAGHADDAEEAISTGKMNLSSTDLELGFVGSTAQIIGMRFNGIDIPQGAVITHAYLQYQVDEANGTASSIEFRGEATDNAEKFRTAAGNISSRADTAAAVSWSPPAWTTVGEAGPDQRTGDLSSIIQEIIDRPGWALNNSLAILATGSGSRVAESFNGKAAAAPLLHIEYAFTGAPILSIAATSNATEPATDGLFTVSLTNSSNTATVIGYTVSGSATPSGQAGADYSALSGTLTIAAGATSATIPVRVLDDQQVEAGESVIVTLNGSISSGDPEINVNTSPATLTIADDDTPATNVQTVESRVAAHADDAEEAISTGKMNLSSTDLELGFVGSTAQIIGMRFNGIDIPQGAVITTAYLQYQVDEANGTGSSIEFRGEDTDNAQQFRTAAGNISARAETTATVSWSPPAWTTVGEAGPDQRTGDLSSIIQEIIDRPGWALNNSLAILATGSGSRVAESFNGTAAAAPLLHIEYAFTGAPILSLAATSNAAEPATDGLFTVFLSTLSGSDTVIGYTVSGSATPSGLAAPDYQALTGNVTIAAGASSATIPVRILDDQQAEGIETVTVTLNGSISSGNPDINVNTSPATLTIADDDSSPSTDISFWVIGDTPYNNAQAAAVSGYLNAVPAQAQFVIHLGDIKAGTPTNVDPATYQSVSSLLQQSSVPVFIIPGDNEFNDTNDPDAAWLNWEANFSFFDQNWTHDFGVSYQTVRQENFAFVSNDVLFVGINLVGGRIHDPQEWADRQADDLAWIESNFSQFANAVSSAVIFGHAAPGRVGYEAFHAGFVSAAQTFADPILYLQGDRHQWLLDQPFAAAPNITRVIIEQTSASADPLLVTASANPAEPFTFDHDFIA